MSGTVTTHESVLLLTLEEISQLVSHSHDPSETLANIVRLIQGRFHTDVCSVYQLEPERGELVLGATIGLEPAGVGQVRMRLGEGLTGLVAETMAPVMVDDAFRHPRFKYFPEAGEDPYHSFLGVPLVEAGAMQGVLVVQTSEPRSFSSDEIRMLVTVAAQLAPLVSGARLLGEMISAVHGADSDEPPAEPRAAPAALRGTALSPGTGLGQAYIANGVGAWQAELEAGAHADPVLEKQRLAQAMAAAREEITRLSRRISALVGEDHGAVLQAQLMILQDRTIEQDLNACLMAGWSAEGAIVQTLNKYVAVFQKLASSYFQERIFDIKDVFRRTLWHLRPLAETTQAAEAPATNRIILVAHEASVLDLFSVDLDLLAGVAVEHGGPQSHAAILARTLGVPMIGQLTGLLSHVRSGQALFVDGTTGVIELDPSPRVVPIRPVPRVSSASAAMPEPARAGLPAVEANINLLCEVEQAVAERAGAVGLYRTEFLFLARRTIPTEEEQVNIYCKLLKGLGGRSASIRTFDLRPDKLAHLASTSSYPFDWRLVLDSPPLQKLFKDQVRAILRAAATGPARILVPLVTRSELLDFVIETVGRARDELRRDGLNHGEDVPLGVMIEATAALPMMETWAEQVDYFALGTNDLIASALGVTREDPQGGQRNDPLHPGFLRLLRVGIEAARRAGRRVTVCGELASDPAGVLALAALRVDAVSVAVNRLGPTREALAAQSAEDLETLLALLLQTRTADEAREVLLPVLAGAENGEPR